MDYVREVQAKWGHVLYGDPIINRREKMDYVYEVQTKNAYMMDVNRVAIEDVADDFLTPDELKEIGDRVGAGIHFFDSKIKEALVEVKSAIKSGKKSAIIKDADLVYTLQRCAYPANYFLPGCRRVGNRLFYSSNGKPEQTAPTFSDWKDLVQCCMRLTNTTYDMMLNVNLTSSDRLKTIEMFRKLLTWEQVEKALTSGGYLNKWTKMMWEDVSTIPQKRSSN